MVAVSGPAPSSNASEPLSEQESHAGLEPDEPLRAASARVSFRGALGATSRSTLSLSAGRNRVPARSTRGKPTRTRVASRPRAPRCCSGSPTGGSSCGAPRSSSPAPARDRGRDAGRAHHRPQRGPARLGDRRTRSCCTTARSWRSKRCGPAPCARSPTQSRRRSPSGAAGRHVPAMTTFGFQIPGFRHAGGTDARCSTTTCAARAGRRTRRVRVGLGDGSLLAVACARRSRRADPRGIHVARRARGADRTRAARHARHRRHVSQSRVARQDGHNARRHLARAAPILGIGGARGTNPSTTASASTFPPDARTPRPARGGRADLPRAVRATNGRRSTGVTTTVDERATCRGRCRPGGRRS